MTPSVTIPFLLLMENYIYFFPFPISVINIQIKLYCFGEIETSVGFQDQSVAHNSNLNLMTELSCIAQGFKYTFSK